MAFLPRALHFFLFGCLSFEFFSLVKIQKIIPSGRPVLVVCALTAYASLSSDLPGPLRIWSSEIIAVSIWIAVLYGITQYHGGGTTLLSFLKSPILLWMGTISYSIYLGHWASIILAQWILSRFLVDVSPLPLALLTFLIAYPVTIISALFLFRYVEQPGIAFGKRLSARISGPPRCS